jgi:uncharacterized membrane protein HdeD (DUF308 family)
MSTRETQPEAERRITLPTHGPADDIREAMRRWTDMWWVFVAVGIAWMIVSALVLRMDTASRTTIGALLGVIFLASAADEFFIGYVRKSWRWAHAILGVLFVAGAIWCFVQPIEAFWALAAAFGLLLILRGSFDIVTSATTHDVNPIWGLGLLVGILEIALGFWASQQWIEVSAALLTLWVGFFAVFRGIQGIVLGFEVRSLRP